MQKIYLSYLRKFPLDYGKARIAKRVKIPKQDGSIQYTNAHGLTFNLDLNEYQMKQIYLYDIYEKNTIRHLLKILGRWDKNQLNVADVGANIGFYSATLAKQLGNRGTIHSFEPNPTTFTRLSNHVSTNQLANIVVNNFGLSDKEEKLLLSFSEHNLGAANIFSSKGKNTVEIELSTLDKYCAQANINELDIIKVDIEGSELKFLQGAQETIQRSPKMLVVMEIAEENCIKAGYKGIDLFEFMIKHGFKAYLPKAWPFSLKQIQVLPVNYHDNIIFLKGW